MNAEATIEAVSDPIAEPVFGPGTPLFPSLRQSAALEFHASVHLLAERARFLTGTAGVAVALEHDGQFVYCAATGSSVPEIGATADVTRHPLGECLKTGQAVLLPIERLAIEASGEESRPRIAVPFLRDERVVGFFEFAPGACVFDNADVEAVTRLFAMVSTALDHLDAAEHTESLIGEAQSEETAPPPSPALWHAPEPDASETTPARYSRLPDPADVHACTTCGFPVSGVRRLCLDCEKRWDDPRSTPKPAAELFASEKQESWISAHGYTIASLLVTALAAAIIFWLR
jgi:GAF domain